MFHLKRVLPAMLLLAWVAGCASIRQTPPLAKIWDRAELWQTPPAQWGARTGLVQEVYYEGEPLQGKPTRVFAYVGRPTNSASGNLPGMVLVHGGGGKAFPAWAEHWARQGYVALAMDLSGHGPNGRLSDGGPDQSDQSKFRDFTADTADQMWTYHAVSAVVRGHSLLRSLPEVAASRIGVTGISWGGYLTCIAAGIDPRFKVAVPVYGCGFLGENSYWKDRSLAAMNAEARELWLALFDPGEYLAQVRRPILFVNGTTDFAYPLDSYRKSYGQVPEKWRYISVEVNRPHGHIWSFPEVDAFAASVLKDSPPPVRLGEVKAESGELSAVLSRPVLAKEAVLSYTSDTGPWEKRQWKSIPASVEGRKVAAALPETRPLVAFLALKDEGNAHYSSEHVEVR